MTKSDTLATSLTGLSISLSVLFKHVDPNHDSVSLRTEIVGDGVSIAKIDGIPKGLYKRLDRCAADNVIPFNGRIGDETHLNLILDRVTPAQIDGMAQKVDAFHRSLLGIDNDAFRFTEATQALQPEEQANCIRFFIGASKLNTKLKVTVSNNPQHPIDPPSAVREDTLTAARSFNQHTQGFSEAEQKMALGLFLKAIDLPETVKRPFLGRAGALPALTAAELGRN